MPVLDFQILFFDCIGGRQRNANILLFIVCFIKPMNKRCAGTESHFAVKFILELIEECTCSRWVSALKKQNPTIRDFNRDFKMCNAVHHKCMYCIAPPPHTAVRALHLN